MELGTLSPGGIIALIGGVTLAPFVAVMITSFTKIVVVLSLLRNALGLQQAPPNVVLNGIAIILSIYVMSPVISQIHQNIEDQGTQSSIRSMSVDHLEGLLESSLPPIKNFLAKHANETETAFFYNTAKKLLPEDSAASLDKSDLMVIIPAFTVSELSAAFQIGFMIFLPFLVIDLVVASILMGLGMMMLAPTVVSLPFKLLLFVFISGWTQLIHGLVGTYV